MDRSWHRPSLFAIALTAFGIAVFSALGLWQVDRAAQKERLFAAYANAMAQTPVTLDAARRMTSNAERYPLVAVRGRYDAAHAYVLVDQTHDGKVGSVASGCREAARSRIAWAVRGPKFSM